VQKSNYPCLYTLEALKTSRLQNFNGFQIYTEASQYLLDCSPSLYQVRYPSDYYYNVSKKNNNKKQCIKRIL
jgi:hypothetical protein